MEKRMVKLHDLQLEYCLAQFDRAPSHISARSLVGECTWHRRIIDELVATRVVPAETNDSMDVGFRSASTVSTAGAATADEVVQAFLYLAVDSALADYILKNLVRHIFGYDAERLAELVRGIFSDYRSSLAVARRQSLSFVASQYSDFVNRVREWRENHEGTEVNEDGVPPAAVDLSTMARKRRALFTVNGVWGIPGWHTGCLVV
jgi:hypothetical protein